MRSAIAKSLLASKQNIPHFYESIDVDVEDLAKLRAELNDLLEPEKIRLSLGDFVSKAVATALLRHPALNATFNGTEITRYGDVHLGMAVAIPDGLIVPVLRNIHHMGLKEIRQRSVDLVDRARAQRLKQDEMTGGTFTVSNLGTFGIREFSAIINPPQVGILAVAAAEKRPVVHNDQDRRPHDDDADAVGRPPRRRRRRRRRFPQNPQNPAGTAGDDAGVTARPHIQLVNCCYNCIRIAPFR